MVHKMTGKYFAGMYVQSNETGIVCDCFMVQVLNFHTAHAEQGAQK